MLAIGIFSVNYFQFYYYYYYLQYKLFPVVLVLLKKKKNRKSFSISRKKLHPKGKTW